MLGLGSLFRGCVAQGALLLFPDVPSHIIPALATSTCPLPPRPRALCALRRHHKAMGLRA